MSQTSTESESGDTTRRVNGIDVSHDQGEIDWSQIKASGIEFAFIKATEGLTIADPDFLKNWADAQADGILVGAYHFFHPGDDPVKQAEFFLRVVGALGGKLPPFADFERPEEWAKFSPVERVDLAQKFLQDTGERSGVQSIVYLDGSFPGDVLGNAQFLAEQPLFLAEYRDDYTPKSEPRVPAPFRDWKFWQHSQTGKVKGIDGDVDLDVFNGSLAQLKALLIPEI
jgi:lysozyme